MSAEIMDGKAISKEIQAEIAVEVAQFTQSSGVTPCLAAVLVGDDPASEVYVRNKHRACERVGIASQMHKLPTSTTEEELLDLIAELNSSTDVHGILVQLPLPEHIDKRKVIEATQKAIRSPLLDNGSIAGARNVLVNITGNSDLLLHEVTEASTMIAEEAHADANVIWGLVVDESMADEVRITV